MFGHISGHCYGPSTRSMCDCALGMWSLYGIPYSVFVVQPLRRCPPSRVMVLSRSRSVCVTSNAPQFICSHPKVHDQTSAEGRSELSLHFALAPASSGLLLFGGLHTLAVFLPITSLDRQICVPVSRTLAEHFLPVKSDRIPE